MGSMAAPRDGDPLSPSGAVVLMGRRGVIQRKGGRSLWTPGTCTWCARPIDPGSRRTKWCSQRCVDAYALTQPDGQIAALEKRDHGVCEACGLDTERLQAACRRLLWIYRSKRVHGQPRILEALAARGLPTSERALAHLVGTRRRWWDGDHTVPIADGGHPCDPENLRTLCYWCHQRETSEAATRRAEVRRMGRPVVAVVSPQMGLFGDR